MSNFRRKLAAAISSDSDEIILFQNKECNGSRWYYGVNGFTLTDATDMSSVITTIPFDINSQTFFIDAVTSLDLSDTTVQNICDVSTSTSAWADKSTWSNKSFTHFYMQNSNGGRLSALYPNNSFWKYFTGLTESKFAFNYNGMSNNGYTHSKISAVTFYDLISGCGGIKLGNNEGNGRFTGTYIKASIINSYLSLEEMNALTALS